jgi:hypothetical protein
LSNRPRIDRSARSGTPPAGRQAERRAIFASCQTLFRMILRERINRMREIMSICRQLQVQSMLPSHTERCSSRGARASCPGNPPGYFPAIVLTALTAS